MRRFVKRKERRGFIKIKNKKKEEKKKKKKREKRENLKKCVGIGKVKEALGG